MRSISLVQVSCDDCKNKFNAPVLSDFEYGSLLFYGINGRVYGLFDAINNSILDSVKIMLSDLGTTRRLTANTQLLQLLVAQLADPIENIPLTIYCVCPYCQSNKTHIEGAKYCETINIPTVTFEKYLMLNTEQQKQLIDDLINRQ